MHSLKPFTFTINLLLLLLSVSSQKPLVDADIEQVTLRDQSSLSLNNNNNNNSYESESDEEDILKRSCSIESNITATNFTYLMKFGLKRYDGEIGYRYVNATPDTGSDIIWFHSKPCDPPDPDCSCYENSECMKKPKKTFDCKDPKCTELIDYDIKLECYSQNDNGLCWYKGIKYADGTVSKGFYGHADFKFTISQSDKTNGIDEKTFRVGFSTSKKDRDIPERNGLVGLGMGGLSLIGQYGGTSKKFSYYLPQFRRKDEKEIIERSKFKFGCKVEIDNEKCTPLLQKQEPTKSECDKRYCVELKSICLKFKGEKCENHRIDTNKHDTHEVITIDSGSTFTYLNDTIFGNLLDKVKEKLKVKSEKLEVNSGKEMLGYENCFEKKEANVEKLEYISFQFGCTTIELKKENFFDEYSVTEPNGDLKNYVCLTVQAQKKKVKTQILGSRAQMDFTVAFDLRSDHKKVSFKNHEILPHAGSVEKVSFENNEKISVLSE